RLEPQRPAPRLPDFKPAETDLSPPGHLDVVDLHRKPALRTQIAGKKTVFGRHYPAKQKGQDGGEKKEDFFQELFRMRRGRFLSTIFTNASTTRGSNCVPRLRESSL